MERYFWIESRSDWPGYETSLQAKVHIEWIVIGEKWIRTAVELVVQSAVE